MKRTYATLLMVLLLTLFVSGQSVTKVMAKKKISGITLEHLSIDGDEHLAMYFQNRAYTYIVDLGHVWFNNQVEINEFINALKAIQENMSDKSTRISFDIADGASISTIQGDCILKAQDGEYRWLTMSQINKLILYFESIRIKN